MTPSIRIVVAPMPFCRLTRSPVCLRINVHQRSLFKERLALAEAKQKANTRTEHGLDKLRKRSVEFGSKVVEALQEELVIQAEDAKERANEDVPEPPVHAPSQGVTRAHRGSVAYYPGALSLAVKVGQCVWHVRLAGAAVDRVQSLHTPHTSLVVAGAVASGAGVHHGVEGEGGGGTHSASQGPV